MKGTLTTHTEILSRDTALEGYRFHPRVSISQHVDTKSNESPLTKMIETTVAQTTYGEPLMVVRTWTDWEPNNSAWWRQDDLEGR